MVMEVMVLLLTVRVAVPMTLLVFDFAVMVVAPKATPVASPAALIVAMVGAEEDHVTWEVTLLWVLFPRVAVAVNCWVLLGRMKPLAGETEIETIVSADGKNPPQLLSRRAVRNPEPNLPSRMNQCTSVILPFQTVSGG